MSLRIAIVAATEKEIEPLLNFLRTHADEHSFQTFRLHGLMIDIIYSGIGILQTTFNLMDYLNHHHPDGWIQAGIGGAFDINLPIGNVYSIESEILVGFGAEEKDGRIMDQFELGWNDPDGFPFTGGILLCPYAPIHDLPLATGMTSLHAHGSLNQIERLRNQPHGQIESMEGAAFFYISLIKKIPFLSIRSISNVVEPRDKSNWKIDLAIQNLNECMIKIFSDSKLNLDRLFRKMSV